MVDITLLGTGALSPIPQRALTAVTLTYGGRTILFDCGEGTQTALRERGGSPVKTDIIALTHYHGDHIFGIPGLLQTMNCMGRTEPLYIAGPKGIDAEMEPLLKLTGWTEYKIHLIEIPKDGLQLSTLGTGWKDAYLYAFETEHRVPSQGYSFCLKRCGKFYPEKASALGVPKNQWKILQKGESVTVGNETILPEQVVGGERKGIKFVFSGDTAFCNSLVDSAKDANLLICEGTYGEDEQADLAKSYGHMTFSQAAKVASSANVGSLWLAHYSQMIQNPEDYLENATKIFPETLCGFDGKTVTLKFEE